MHRINFPAILTICLILTNCSLPQTPSTPPPDNSITSTNTVPPPLPTPELGQAENPLILTLPSFSSNSPEQINAAKLIAEQLSQRTGYSVVVAASDLYISIVDALEKGNAHIVLLDALSYATAYQKDLVTASFVEIKDGKKIGRAHV